MPKNIQIDGSKITDWDSFHDQFSQTLGFPGFYGRNMDAWNDCMTSLDAPADGLSSVHASPGDVLVLCISGVSDLKEGANPDAQDDNGFAPLHFAAQESLPEATRLLIAAGANPNIQDSFGNTPLARVRHTEQGMQVEERVGRGPRRGAILKSTSSPPSDGREGVWLRRRRGVALHRIGESVFHISSAPG